MSLLLAPRSLTSSLSILQEEAGSAALEASIVATLSSRLCASLSPYTEVGPSILISLNPYSALSAEGGGPPLYDSAATYRGSAPQTLPPHLFALAELVSQGLATTPQGIVISGESGSGKTEAARLLISYLAGARTQASTTERLQQGTLLLEALGNARTLNNANSSRFGKLTELHLTPQGTVTHAVVQFYLYKFPVFM